MSTKTPTYTSQVFQGADGQWFWRIRSARNGRIVAVGGEGFRRRSSASMSLSRFLVNVMAPGAVVPAGSR